MKTAGVQRPPNLVQAAVRAALTSGFLFASPAVAAPKWPPLTAAKGTLVIPVPNQYKCIGCSPGRHSDTRRMATGSDDDSRDNVHDRCSCIAV